MPCAASPSAIAFTSSGCSLQKSATWSKASEVFSTSQTAVALGISGASLMVKSPLRSDRPIGRSLNVIGDDGNGRNIGTPPGAGAMADLP